MKKYLKVCNNSTNADCLRERLSQCRLPCKHRHVRFGQHYVINAFWYIFHYLHHNSVMHDDLITFL